MAAGLPWIGSVLSKAIGNSFSFEKNKNKKQLDIMTFWLDYHSFVMGMFFDIELQALDRVALFLGTFWAF